MNGIFQLLNPTNTITVNRPLAHAVGLSEAIIYATLISKCYYYSERSMLDADGWFYSTVPDLQESTALSERQQKRCVDNLVQHGLIECQTKGMPAKRSFRIVENVELLEQLIRTGEALMSEIKPAAAVSYEKKRKQSEEAVEETVNSSENTVETALNRCSDESAEQAPTNDTFLLRQNVGACSCVLSDKSNISKTNIIKSNMIVGREPTAKPSHDECRTQMAQKIHLTAIQKKYGEEFAELVLDVVLECLSSNNCVKIGDITMPPQQVRLVYADVNESVIASVADSIAEKKTKIHNLSAYLRSALYNTVVEQKYMPKKAENSSAESSFDVDELEKRAMAKYGRGKKTFLSEM